MTANTATLIAYHPLSEAALQVPGALRVQRFALPLLLPRLKANGLPPHMLERAIDLYCQWDGSLPTS